ncbi:hypothetical protein NE237_009450 [Protea cynaroides]|uniref:Uncharacterized protein n=1 Tax=Protea cynaroides TaxID=273540 RepID=A0A9Q0R0A9_9MAGN|nr:hypothetical protein NE237_009450 [Protea cynaroides]
MAGARFCEFALSEGASLTALMELASVFVHSTLSPDDLNADQVEGVLVAAANLCHCLISEASCKAALKELFSGGKLKCFLFKECMGLIINCSGLVGNVEMQTKVRSTHKLLLPSVKQKKTKSSVKISRKWKHVRGKKSYCSETSNFEENYVIAAAIAWQRKDFFLHVSTRMHHHFWHTCLLLCT